MSEQRIAGILSHGASEVALRLAVALGLDNAHDLAAEFAKAHPSDRMRLAAWEAQALAADDDGVRDALWGGAEASGSRMVAGEARRRRMELVG